jgi:hypothetical protein
MPVFDALLAGWKAQGYELVAIRDVVARHDPKLLPLHSVEMGALPGRSGTLALQGAPFLPELSALSA